MKLFGKAPRRSLFSRRARRRSVWVRLLAVVVAAGLAWLIGLVWFAGSLPREVADRDTVTDGIVVLTGGAERIETGISLLAARKAEKLLLSGAGVGWHRDGVEALSDRRPELFACCIVIDYEAEDTAGNAAGAARWAHAEGYRSLRVVTANYHMPRSLVELGRAMPGIRLIAHPVAPVHVRLENWWIWPGTASLLAREYSKYLVSVARARLLRAFAGDRT